MLGWSVEMTSCFLNFVLVPGTGRSFKIPARHKLKRVCLEVDPVVRIKMLYKRWKTLINLINVWRSSEPNWPMNDKSKRVGLPQTIVRDSLQITLCCWERKLSWWWTIRKNGNNDSCRWVLRSRIEWISDRRLVMLKKRCWKQVVTFVSVKSAKDDLIAVGITSGVKLARLQHRLL